MIRNSATLKTFHIMLCPEDKKSCSGPGCMAWVWECDSASERFHPDDKYNEQAKREAKLFDKEKRRGWCGLVK